MSVAVNLGLTTAGQALKAKIEMGEGAIPLELTRITTASGMSNDPLNLTAGVDEQQQYTIISKSTVGERTILSAVLTNTGLTVGYPMSQILFYAIDPDVGEILYRITQFANPIPVPAESERNWKHKPKFNIVTGNASEVIINIEQEYIDYPLIVDEMPDDLPIDGTVIVPAGDILAGDDIITGGDGAGTDLSEYAKKSELKEKYEELLAKIEAIIMGEIEIIIKGGDV